jgi:hypothetical protein
MSGQDYHRQCQMNKVGADGSVAHQTSWLPAEFAHVGNIVKLRDDKGHWEDGWKIIAVGPPLASEYVAERARDFTRTRKASDI